MPYLLRAPAELDLCKMRTHESLPALIPRKEIQDFGPAAPASKGIIGIDTINDSLKSETKNEEWKTVTQASECLSKEKANVIHDLMPWIAMAFFCQRSHAQVPGFR